MIARDILVHDGPVSIAARANNPYAVFVIRLRTAADYVTIECGLIIEDIWPIVKRRIFSHGIIGTDLLFITNATGNKECGDRSLVGGDRKRQVLRT